MGFSFTSNKAAILAAVEQAKQAALAQAADLVVDAAKENAPVESGTLKESIDAEVSGDTLTVGAGAPYAAFVEFGHREGDHHVPGRPFLGPALEDAAPVIQDIFAEELRKRLGS